MHTVPLHDTNRDLYAKNQYYPQFQETLEKPADAVAIVAFDCVRYFIVNGVPNDQHYAVNCEEKRVNHFS